MDYKKEAEELRSKADLMDWVADGGEVEITNVEINLTAQFLGRLKNENKV